MMQPFKKYEARDISFLQRKEISGYQLKVYRILFGKKSFDQKLLNEAFEIAEDILPTPAITQFRPGVGFLILHQGCGADYLILSWWDNENELPTEIFVYDNDWRKAKKNESFCVWDLEVIGHERQAYVDTILSGSETSMVEDYLSRTLANATTQLQ